MEAEQHVPFVFQDSGVNSHRRLGRHSLELSFFLGVKSSLHHAHRALRKRLLVADGEELPLPRHHQVVVLLLLDQQLDHVAGVLHRHQVGQSVDGEVRHVPGSVQQAGLVQVDPRVGLELHELVHEEREEGHVPVKQRVATRDVEVAVHEHPRRVLLSAHVAQAGVDVVAVPDPLVGPRPVGPVSGTGEGAPLVRSQQREEGQDDGSDTTRAEPRTQEFLDGDRENRGEADQHENDGVVDEAQLFVFPERVEAEQQEPGRGQRESIAHARRRVQ